MKKLMLLFTVAAIVALVYLGCKKERPANVISDNNAERIAKAQNEFTVEEFEMELITKLNTQGIKIHPTDATHDHIKKITTNITDLEVEMVTDSTGKITKAELERVYKKARDEAHDAAKNEFPQGKDRVLGFVLDTIIILPPAAAGTVQTVMVKLSGVIGNGITTMPPCTINTPVYRWFYNDASEIGTMIFDMEQRLNSPACVPNFLSTCPDPIESLRLNRTVELMVPPPTCFPAPPFGCFAWFALDICGPKPESVFTAADVQAMIDGLRANALSKAPQCPCSGQQATPYKFALNAYELQRICVDRFIEVSYIYRCCGLCQVRKRP